MSKCIQSELAEACSEKYQATGAKEIEPLPFFPRRKSPLLTALQAHFELFKDTTAPRVIAPEDM